MPRSRASRHPPAFASNAMPEPVKLPDREHWHLVDPAKPPVPRKRKGQPDGIYLDNIAGRDDPRKKMPGG
jgi:hypothetical protein